MTIGRWAEFVGFGLVAVLGLVDTFVGVVPERLIPDQVDWIPPVASLFVLLVLAGLWFRPAWLERVNGVAWIVGLAGLVFLVYAQAELVVRLEDYGNDPVRHFLTGFELSETGEEMLARADALDVDRAQQIRIAGADRIPMLYGDSYRIAVYAYSGAVILFLVSIAVLFGNATGTEEEGS